MHHGVRIQDAALVAAAVLSDRYLTGRFLPDKAIDLMDEAASKLRIEIDSLPTEIDVVERRVRQLEIERVALAKETDAASAGPARGASTPSWPTSSSSATACWPTGPTRRRPSAASGPSRRSSRACAATSSARPTSRRRPRSATAASPSSSARSTRPARALDELQGGHADAEGGGRRRGRRRDRGQVDRRPRLAASWRARWPSSSAWRTSSTSGSSARTKPSRRWPTPSAAAGPACPTRTAPSARSCSSAPPASARPSWPAPWPTSSSTTSGPWSAST